MYSMHLEYDSEDIGYQLVFVIVSKLSSRECFDRHCVEHHGITCLNGDQAPVHSFDATRIARPPRPVIPSG